MFSLKSKIHSFTKEDYKAKKKKKKKKQKNKKKNKKRKKKKKELTTMFLKICHMKNIKMPLLKSNKMKTQNENKK